VGGRRNGSLPVTIVAEQANLSEGVAREALDRAAAAGIQVEQMDNDYEWKTDD
jgi:hypothetical protein